MGHGHKVSRTADRQGQRHLTKFPDLLTGAGEWALLTDGARDLPDSATEGVGGALTSQ